MNGSRFKQSLGHMAQHSSFFRRYLLLFTSLSGLASCTTLKEIVDPTSTVRAQQKVDLTRRMPLQNAHMQHNQSVEAAPVTPVVTAPAAAPKPYDSYDAHGNNLGQQPSAPVMSQPMQEEPAHGNFFTRLFTPRQAQQSAAIRKPLPDNPYFSRDTSPVAPIPAAETAPQMENKEVLVPEAPPQSSQAKTETAAPVAEKSESSSGSWFSRMFHPAPAPAPAEPSDQPAVEEDKQSKIVPQISPKEEAIAPVVESKEMQTSAPKAEAALKEDAVLKEEPTEPATSTEKAAETKLSWFARNFGRSKQPTVETPPQESETPEPRAWYGKGLHGSNTESEAPKTSDLAQSVEPAPLGAEPPQLLASSNVNEEKTPANAAPMVEMATAKPAQAEPVPAEEPALKVAAVEPAEASAPVMEMAAAEPAEEKPTWFGRVFGHSAKHDAPEVITQHQADADEVAQEPMPEAGTVPQKPEEFQPLAAQRHDKLDELKRDQLQSAQQKMELDSEPSQLNATVPVEIPAKLPEASAPRPEQEKPLNLPDKKTELDTSPPTDVAATAVVSPVPVELSADNTVSRALIAQEPEPNLALDNAPVIAPQADMPVSPQEQIAHASVSPAPDMPMDNEITVPQPASASLEPQQKELPHASGSPILIVPDNEEPGPSIPSRKALESAPVMESPVAVSYNEPQSQVKNSAPMPAMETVKMMHSSRYSARMQAVHNGAAQ